MSNFRLIKFKNLESEDLVNPLCIIGMPGIADIGKFALDQLIGIFQAKKFCEIIFNDYPAGAIVDNSILSTPKAEILYYKDPKENQDIILITADAQAMSPRGIYEISDYLASIIQNLGVTKVLSLGAYPTNIMNQNGVERKIYVTSTNPEPIEYFSQKNEMEKLSKGVIIGSNGLIPTLANARFGIEGVVFLAETNNSAIIDDNFTDLDASVHLLDVVSRHYGLPIEKDFNQKDINKISQDLESRQKKLEKELGSVKNILKNKLGSDESLYI